MEASCWEIVQIVVYFQARKLSTCMTIVKLQCQSTMVKSCCEIKAWHMLHLHVHVNKTYMSIKIS